MEEYLKLQAFIVSTITLVLILTVVGVPAYFAISHSNYIAKFEQACLTEKHGMVVQTLSSPNVYCLTGNYNLEE